MTLRIGSRGSDLALWQARYIADLLGGASITVIKTQGDITQHLSLDKIEGKGFFTKEIEAALLDRSVDIAVHSYKDLPTEAVPGLLIAAVPVRAPVNDVIVTRAVDASMPLGLAHGARVGTSSIRRKAQLLCARADLKLVDIRGNVPTRVGKVTSGELDAVVLAQAGLTRLGLMQAPGLVMQSVPIETMTPAAAQGALAVQIRVDDVSALAQVSALNDRATANDVALERALLARFGGGCHLPLGVHAHGESLFASVTAPDGSERLVAQASAVSDVHASLVRQGAARYL